MNSDVLVSICCITYNHAPYIRQCLDGFIMQKTNFKFEILIHDDASTDGTANIIREYEENYPNIFKPIYQTENQYSKGKNISATYNWPRAIGKYIAQCEGDDYWTDPLKLQRQVDFLEANPEYSMSTENAIVLHKDGRSWNFSEKETKDVSMEELLIQRQFPTASVVMRVEMLKSIYQIGGIIFDTFIWTYMAQKGKIHYQNVVSSVYNRGDGVTEWDKIKWAYTVEAYNKSMYEKLDIPSHIIKKRNQTQVIDCYLGFKVAKEQKKYKEAIDLLGKCIQYDAIFFIKYLLRNNKRYLIFSQVKRKIKNILRKIS